MEISILQWNVWYKEDIRNIAKFLLANPADIICLQELTRGYQHQESDTIKYIAKRLGYYYHFQEIPFDDDRWTQANGIFSRFPIVIKDSLWINEPTGTGHYDDEYRAYIEVTIKVDDRELTVGTTHMSYTNGFIGSVRKEQEADKVLNIVSNKKLNYIFTGDLNAAPDSNTVCKISKVLNNVGPDIIENTWTTKPFSYDGFVENNLNWRLDYIFASNDIQIVSSKVLETNFSDHLPVLAHLRLA